MPRRGENIYKRKDGRWEARVLEPDGKYRYVYAKTYKEVKERKQNYQEYIKLRPKILPEQIAAAAGLFADWLQGDVVNQVKPSTYENYYFCMKKYVLPFFKETGNEFLTENTVDQFTKSIHSNPKISESYKRKILIIFKTALKEVAKGSPGFSGLMEAVKLPKATNPEVQAFSVSEQRMIEQAAFHEKDIRAIGIILTFYTGIRLGELCALKWCDLDYEAGTISITKTVSRVKNPQRQGRKTALLVGTPKSRKSRRKIPLPKFLRDVFMEYKKKCPDENCFLFSGTEDPPDPRVYEKLFKNVLKSAGVKERKFHTTRHTFATRALEVGVDIKTLSEILGHSSVTITLNIYAHSLMEQKIIAMDKLNDMHITQMGIAS